MAYVKDTNYDDRTDEVVKRRQKLDERSVRHISRRFAPGTYL